jgi:hypothetical protein
MREVFEKRIQELTAAADQQAVQYHALMGRLSEARDLLAKWFEDQCKSNENDAVESDESSSKESGIEDGSTDPHVKQWIKERANAVG